MLIVHHLNDSRSQRILWLLEELEVPYEIKKYERLPSMRAPPELFAVNPLGKTPVIEDGELTVAESGAVIEYIIQKYGQGKLPVLEGNAHMQDIYYLHYAEGSFMPILVNKLIFSVAPSYSPWWIRPLVRMVTNGMASQIVEPELKKHQDLLEKHLSQTEWLASASGPTAADFSMSMAAEVLVHENIAGPATVAYVKRIHDRPAYRRGLKKGGEYAYGPKL